MLSAPSPRKPKNPATSDDHSTGSDESNYTGWSDQWRTDNTRPSTSSGDEPRPVVNVAAPIPRAVSFTPHHPAANVSQRRQTLSRVSNNTLHNNPSNIHLDALGSQQSSVLGMSDMATPLGGPPPYPDNGYGGVYTRSRRKSISTGPLQLESETSPDEKYPHGTTKAKKKRTRTSSFSLPFHQRRRRLSNAGWLGWSRWYIYYQEHAQKYGLIALLALVFVFAIIQLRRTYELQIELSLFSYRWIKDEFDTAMPLRGCFDPQHVSPLYDMERHLAPKYNNLAPGVSLKRGTACYDFSSTVQPIPGVEPEHLVYHTYWRADLIPFGERHTATLASFLATQPLGYSKLILWTNGLDTISNNSHVRPFLEKWGDNIEIRQVDMKWLTKGTEIEGLLSGGDGGGLYDERAWVDGDAVRLLVLWHYGGVWMDMDQILTRDLHPLIEHEFVIQWDCYDKPYFSLNGALMHFRKHSPYLCEAFHIMASSPLPKPNTFTWGAHLYAKLHRRLLASHVKPFTVLPWCFADPRNCRSDIRFPDPFKPDPKIWGGRRWDGKGEVGRTGKELLEENVGYVWTVHLHNQWLKDFPKGGWVERLLERYRGQLESLERYARSIGRQPRQAIVSAREGSNGQTSLVDMNRANNANAAAGQGARGDSGPGVKDRVIGGRTSSPAGTIPGADSDAEWTGAARAKPVVRSSDEKVDTEDKVAEDVDVDEGDKVEGKHAGGSRIRQQKAHNGSLHKEHLRQETVVDELEEHVVEDAEGTATAQTAASAAHKDDGTTAARLAHD